jgi:hypothetical protein
MGFDPTQCGDPEYVEPLTRSTRNQENAARALDCSTHFTPHNV